MKRKAARGRRAGIRPDILTITGILMYTLVLMFRIPLSNIIKDNGMGYFSAVNEIYLIADLFFTYGFSSAVASLVKYRIRREQYRSAEKVFYRGLWGALVLSFGAALILFFFPNFVAEILILERYSALPIRVMAFSLICCGITGVFRGYFQGVGSYMPTVHSLLLERVVFILTALLFTAIAGGYGEKAAALLRNREYTAVYQVMGISAALLFSNMLSTLHMILIFLMYRSRIVRQRSRDNTKSTEGGVYLFRMLFFPVVINGIYTILLQWNTIVDQRIFYYYSNRKEVPGNHAVNWGIYYGRALPVIGGIALLCCLLPGSQLKRIAKLIERDEIREAKEKLKQEVHRCAVFTIFFAVFAAVMPEVISSVFWGGNQQKLVSMIRMGSVLIILIPFAYLFMGLMYLLKKNLWVLSSMAGAFVLHYIVCSLLMGVTTLQIEGIIIGNIVFYLGILVSGFIGVSRKLRYIQEWGRTFLTTLISVLAPGLLFLLLKILLYPAVGGVLTLLPAFLLGIPVYFIALIALRGADEEELTMMPGGSLMFRLAKMIHIVK